MNASSMAHDLLTFRMGNENFGVDIGSVQEIRRYEAPVRIAHAPAHVRGVVNLRGTVVPVIDLRRRLGYEQAPLDASTATIVLQSKGRTLGVVVDAVSDVVHLDDSHEADTQTAEHTLAGSLITGMAHHDDGLLAVLDLSPLFAETASAH